MAAGYTDPAFWGLPDDTFLELRGLPLRAMQVLAHRLQIGEILLTHSERGVKFWQPRTNQASAVVPDAKMIVLMKTVCSCRLSWVTPCEVFRLQGVVLPRRRTPAELSCQELLRIGGAAFHVQSAVAHVVATVALMGAPLEGCCQQLWRVAPAGPVVRRGGPPHCLARPGRPGGAGQRWLRSGRRARKVLVTLTLAARRRERDFVGKALAALPRIRLRILYRLCRFLCERCRFLYGRRRNLRACLRFYGASVVFVREGDVLRRGLGNLWCERRIL